MICAVGLALLAFSAALAPPAKTGDHAIGQFLDWGRHAGFRGLRQHAGLDIGDAFQR
jgi:hypothetical protein